MRKILSYLKKHSKKLSNDNRSQVIVLAGVVMFISIIFISSYAPDIANISVSVSSEKAASTIQDFMEIKKVIPYALTFNLAENISIENNNFVYYGNISNLTQKIDSLKDTIRTFKLKQNIEFDMILNDYWIAHPGNVENVYYVNFIMTLKDPNEYQTEDVIISIVCNPKNQI